MLPTIKAIIFDANVFGSDVEPRTSTIEKWAKACAEHDAELWIPEVVCWELSQRVIERNAQIRESIKVHNSHRSKWGQSELPLPDEITPEEVRSWIVGAGAYVVETKATAALEGLQDQVLQSGPGSLKRGVKTGAADSAWLRSVAELNGGTFEDLIIVTGDTHAVEQTCEALNIEVPELMKSIGDLTTNYVKPSPASTAQSAALRQALDDLLLDPHDWQVAELIDRSYRELSQRWPDSDHSYWQEQNRSLGLAIDSLRNAVLSPWIRSLSCEAEVALNAEATFTRPDREGSGYELCTSRVDGVATVRVVAYLNTETTCEVGEIEILTIEVTQSEWSLID